VEERRELSTEYGVKWTNDGGEAGEANTERIKRGRGKQQRTKLAERDGVKMERV